MIMLDPSSQFGEIKGGRDIYPMYHHEKCVDGAPIWEVEDEGDVKVYAAPMSHGVSFDLLSSMLIEGYDFLIYSLYRNRFLVLGM